jgi:hypothetical protein
MMKKGNIKLKIPDNFIENMADHYIRCVVKPFDTFEKYLDYSWNWYNRYNNLRLKRK